MDQPVGSLPSPSWPGIVGSAIAALGFLWAVLRAGARRLTAERDVANAIQQLTASVGRIEDEVRVYIESDRSRNDTMSQWQRQVDSRLSGIEARLDGLWDGEDRRRQVRRT